MVVIGEESQGVIKNLKVKLPVIGFCLDFNNTSFFLYNFIK